MAGYALQIPGWGMPATKATSKATSLSPQRHKDTKETWYLGVLVVRSTGRWRPPPTKNDSRVQSRGQPSGRDIRRHEDEFLNRFGTGSARRRWLAGRLGELLALARLTGQLQRVFVWGSFVTARESPNDVDVLLLMRDDFRLDDCPEPSRAVFDHAAARMLFQADVFWSRASIGDEMLSLWLDTYQTARDFRRRGIVEVKAS